MLAVTIGRVNDETVCMYHAECNGCGVLFPKSFRDWRRTFAKAEQAGWIVDMESRDRDCWCSLECLYATVGRQVGGDWEGMDR